MSPFQRLLKETHRRGLWQVLVVFAGGGWGVLGVIDTLIGYGYLPQWVFGGGLLALLMGLPVVSATAWVQGGRGVRPPAGAGDPEDEALLAALEAGAASSDIFTWPRAVTGGVLAFALLGLLSAGYMFMRATGIGAPGTLVAQGVLQEGARMVLADFESSAGEAAPGDLLTESLRIDLAQSDALSLVSEADVRAALSRMRRDRADPITETVALEIAERVGATAVIGGEVGRVGSGFVINARVLATGSGEPLAQFRVTASDEDELLDTIDELARSMRDKIGESLRSIASSGSLGAVTTSSIEALRKYTSASQGLDRGTVSAPVAQQLFQEAVALDSTFASAHRALAIAIFNFGGDGELMAASTRAAYRHRERLPDRERLGIEAFYHRFSGQVEEAARAYRAMLALDPGNYPAAVNLSDILIYAGDYEEAIEVSLGAPAWDSNAWAFNLMASLAATGRFEEAEAVNDSLVKTLPDEQYHTWRKVMLNATSGRPQEALEAAAEAPAISDPAANAHTQYAIGVASVEAGRVAAARELYGAVVRDLRTYSGPENALAIGLALPWVTLVVLEDPAAALADLEALKRQVDWESLSAFNRMYPQLALFEALAGQPDRATELMDSFDREVDPDPDPRARARARLVRAVVAEQRGESGAMTRVEEALAGIGCARCAHLLGGLMYETAGDQLLAIDAYEAYVGQPFFDGGTFFLHGMNAAVHDRLGRLYELQGDGEKAAQHYLRFAEQWSDPDPALRPRAERARRRAAELGSTP